MFLKKRLSRNNKGLDELMFPPEEETAKNPMDSVLYSLQGEELDGLDDDYNKMKFDSRKYSIPSYYIREDFDTASRNLEEKLSQIKSRYPHRVKLLHSLGMHQRAIILLLQDSLPHEWNELHWLYLMSPQRRAEIQKQFLNSLKKLDEWLNFYSHFNDIDELKNLGQKQILELITTHEDCVQSYFFTIDRSDFCDHILDKLLSFSLDFKNWCLVFDRLIQHQHHHYSLNRNLQEAHTQAYQKIRKHTLEKMVEHATEIEEFRTIWDRTKFPYVDDAHTAEISALVMEKMIHLTSNNLNLF